MCGISGIYNYLDKKVNSRSIIQKIIEIQNLRGPDDKGIWESECKKICFGHNRLSIIDLTKDASQPFISIDNNFVITFNGEIYNFKEIKEELLKKNIKFKSNSDTEVIIESYKYWGLEFYKKLRGMFAFALWDINNKKLILARDPFGIKPLYYSIKNNIYYFASQIRSLLSINDISSNKNNSSIVDFYLWGSIQEPRTLYKDIKSLEKGSCLIIDENGVEKKSYFANIKEEIINSSSLNFKNKNESIEYLSEIFNETIKYHQVSDVPVTFLLSSGIDSSSILASIKNKDNCSALTLDLDTKDMIMDEKLLATETAKINNIPHKIIKLTDEEILQNIETFYKNMDSPTNDGLNNFLISKVAKMNGSKVIVSGIGGDEFFYGYPSFKNINLANNLLKLVPNFKVIDNFSKKSFYNFLKTRKLNTKYSGVYDYGRNISKGFLLQRSLFLPHEIEDLLSPNIFKAAWDELNIIDNLNNDIENFKEKKLSIMYLEIKYYLTSKLLKDSDWTSMSNSVEMRTPFIDWEFFKKIIPFLKSNIDINKKLLLDCVKDKVPKELYKRRKTGFGIPHKNYLEKISKQKMKYSHSIKDWSLFSYRKYLENYVK